VRFKAQARAYSVRRPGATAERSQAVLLAHSDTVTALRRSGKQPQSPLSLHGVAFFHTKTPRSGVVLGTDKSGLAQRTMSVNLEDKLLIWRFNRGDYDAVRRVYEKYKNELLALAESLLNNTAAAEDVVHDVFMSFLQLKHFRLTGSLKGYLATCVANAARNKLRADARHRQEPLDQAKAIEGSDAGPDGEAICGEERRLLGRALGELPYEQREVVLLHLQGGLRFAEIARSQNISINTALGRYRYGLEKLRTKLNGEVFRCERMIQLKS
jgi:RNA polymerase sigma-70 factor, ECF subfamily